MRSRSQTPPSSLKGRPLSRVSASRRAPATSWLPWRYPYAEFGGKLKFACKKKNGSDHASENFNKFFVELGPPYRAFRAAGHNVYDIFRCGLAHEYYVKKSCTISMRVDQETAPGIGLQPDGRYYFAVEPYCRDLEQAFVELERYLYGDAATI